MAARKTTHHATAESKRAILIVRADLQATIGDQVPFFEQSSLGGQNNLRGYGVDRFIDKNLVAASIEERIHLARAKIAGVAADFELATFVDTGQVFNSFKDVSFKDYRVTPGFGFRAMRYSPAVLVSVAGAGGGS